MGSPPLNSMAVIRWNTMLFVSNFGVYYEAYDIKTGYEMELTVQRFLREISVLKQDAADASFWVHERSRHGKTLSYLI